MVKVAVLLLCAVGLIHAEKESLHFSPAFMAKMMAKGTSCVLQSGVSPTALTQLVANTLPDTPKNRRFAYCFFREMDLADEDGHFQISNMMLMPLTPAQKQEVEAVVTDCNNISGSDRYETMFRIHQCFHSNLSMLLSIGQ